MPVLFQALCLTLITGFHCPCPLYHSFSCAKNAKNVFQEYRSTRFKVCQKTKAVIEITIFPKCHQIYTIKGNQNQIKGSGHTAKKCDVRKKSKHRFQNLDKFLEISRNFKKKYIFLHKTKQLKGPFTVLLIRNWRKRAVNKGVVL